MTKSTTWQRGWRRQLCASSRDSENRNGDPPRHKQTEAANTTKTSAETEAKRTKKTNIDTSIAPGSKPEEPQQQSQADMANTAKNSETGDDDGKVDKTVTVTTVKTVKATKAAMACALTIRCNDDNDELDPRWSVKRNAHRKSGTTTREGESDGKNVENGLNVGGLYSHTQRSWIDRQMSGGIGPECGFFP
jgi:hypothetical protein